MGLVLLQHVLNFSPFSSSFLGFFLHSESFIPFSFCCLSSSFSFSSFLSPPPPILRCPTSLNSNQSSNLNPMTTKTTTMRKRKTRSVLFGISFSLSPSSSRQRKRRRWKIKQIKWKVCLWEKERFFLRAIRFRNCYIVLKQLYSQGDILLWNVQYLIKKNKVLVKA